VRRNGLAIVRAYALYQPLRTFAALAAVFTIGALAAWSPFLIDWILSGQTEGHLQSLILGAVLALVAVQLLALGIIGDTLAGQRVIAQRTFERVRRLELGAGIEPSHYARVERPRTQPSSGPEQARSARDAPVRIGRSSTAG
jgi:hypothetical protein